MNKDEAKQYRNNNSHQTHFNEYGQYYKRNNNPNQHGNNGYHQRRYNNNGNGFNYNFRHYGNKAQTPSRPSSASNSQEDYEDLPALTNDPNFSGRFQSKDQFTLCSTVNKDETNKYRNNNNHQNHYNEFGQYYKRNNNPHQHGNNGYNQRRYNNGNGFNYHFRHYGNNVPVPTPTPTPPSTQCNSPEDYEDLPASPEEYEDLPASPEDYEDLPALTNDARLYNQTVFSKEFSPNGTYCVCLPQRVIIPHIAFPREWFEDLEPDEIMKQFSRAGYVKEKPQSVGPENLLDSAIWNKFLENQQTSETFRKKVELWRDVYRLVRYMSFTPDFKHDPRNFPAFGLQVVGSTMSGFGSNTSDVDMCLVIRDSEVDQRFEAVERLQTLSNTLQLLPYVDNAEMIYAKVPILKFRDSSRRLDVDLNCNNFVGIRNTHLLYAYAQMDWRLKPLILVVKLWAQFHRINDAKNMTISSYSLVLMVIHFLQCGLEEPILPALQKMYPEKFSIYIPILNIKIHECFPPWESRNKMGLGELLIQFLEYYSRKFDYTRNAISVRLGGTMSTKSAANYKSHKNDFHQWKYLCVEEPFDRTNTARSVYDRDIFERIIGIFYASWQRLVVSQELDSIFIPISEEDLRAISNVVVNRFRSDAEI